MLHDEVCVCVCVVSLRCLFRPVFVHKRHRSRQNSEDPCVSLCVCLQTREQMGIPLTQQASNESRLSMSESVSEFFDAQEVLLSASSSENEV